MLQLVPKESYGLRSTRQRIQHTESFRDSALRKSRSGVKLIQSLVGAVALVGLLIIAKASGFDI